MNKMKNIFKIGNLTQDFNLDKNNLRIYNDGFLLCESCSLEFILSSNGKKNYKIFIILWF